MAPTASTALTTKAESGSPYQLDPAQTLRAAKSLTKHVQAERKRLDAAKPVKGLLQAEDSDEEAAEEEDVPVVCCAPPFVRHPRPNGND